MLPDLRGISSDGRALALHARGGGTDARILQKRTYVFDVEEKTFLFFSCVVLVQPKKIKWFRLVFETMEPTKRGHLATLVGLEPTAFEYLYRNA